MAIKFYVFGIALGALLIGVGLVLLVYSMFHSTSWIPSAIVIGAGTPLMMFCMRQYDLCSAVIGPSSAPRAIVKQAAMQVAQDQDITLHPMHKIK